MTNRLNEILLNEVEEGSIETIKSLLKAGANIEAKTKEGNTPLDFAKTRIAREKGCAEIVELLEKEVEKRKESKNEFKSLLINQNGMKRLNAIRILEGEIKRLQRKLNEKEEQTFEIDKKKEEKDNLEMDIVDLEKTKKELKEFINEIKKKKDEILSCLNCLSESMKKIYELND